MVPFSLSISSSVFPETGVLCTLDPPSYSVYTYFLCRPLLTVHSTFLLSGPMVLYTRDKDQDRGSLLEPSGHRSGDT